MNDVRQSFARAGLIRSSDSRWLGGVCAGLGRKFGFGPGASRALFLLLMIALPGCPILIYPVLWICMPLEGRTYGSPTTPLIQ